MNIEEYRKSLRNGLFADRSTLNEAYDYALMIAKSSESPALVMTAVHVIMNTIAKELGELEMVINE
jgi:hypothetical protein